MSDFWSTVDKLREASIGSPPTGDYFTTVQWAQRYDIPLYQARDQLRSLVNKGVLVVKKWGGWNYYTTPQEKSKKPRKG